MYKIGNMKDLNEISSNTLTTFNNSNLDECAFFNCEKENLISLRDYLVELKMQKESYKQMISEPLKSIQKKNEWCTDIQPYLFILSPGFSMEATSKNYPSIRIYEDNNGILFGSGIQISNNPFIRFFSTKKWRERRKIIENSEEELLEIEEICKSFGFTSGADGIFTASNNFLITAIDFDTILVVYKELFKPSDERSWAKIFPYRFAEMGEEHIKKLYLQKK